MSVVGAVRSLIHIHGSLRSVRTAVSSQCLRTLWRPRREVAGSWRLLSSQSGENSVLEKDAVVVADMEGYRKTDRPEEVINRHVKSSASYRRLYEAVYQRSIDRPEEFWGEAAEELVWFKRWDKVLDDFDSPFAKWFVGGELNVSHNCLDRHVERGFGRQVAIIHDSPMIGLVRKITYKELLSEVAQFASVLSTKGVQYGDRVLIYMPMIPEAVVAMLACARIGAVHSLVFGGFPAKELSRRIDHVEPKVIVSANCSIDAKKVVNYKPILDQAIELSAFKPQTCIIFNRKHFKDAPLVRGRDYDWDDLMTKAKFHGSVAVKATDPLYILYTSGTTGIPKAVVRPSGGHAVVLNWSMFNIYGVNKHETWFAASDLGWVVGHSYCVYAPLLHCNTTVIYEGKAVSTPDPSAYYRILQDHDVVAMFVEVTTMRALRREDPRGNYAAKYSVPRFRYMFLAGEHCDHKTVEWVRNRFQVPCLDHWWQTETGSPITGTCVGLGNELYPPTGVVGKRVPGWDTQVVRNDLTPCNVGELGNLVIKLPLAPGSLSSLYKADGRFSEFYFKKFPGYYDTMDTGMITEEGNVAIMARTEDIINVGGKRLATGTLEEAILEHTDVAEAAVVGFPDVVKGQVPLGLCVLNAGVTTPRDQLIREVIEKVEKHIGSDACFERAIIVPRLPKTRSGKVARNTIAAMAAGNTYKIPVTIENAAVYTELAEAFVNAGYKIASSTTN